MSDEAKKSRPTPWWRRKRILFPSIALYVVVDLLAGGFAYKSGGRALVRVILEKQGFAATFKLEGSLWNGPRLSQVSLRGTNNTKAS